MGGIRDYIKIRLGMAALSLSAALVLPLSCPAGDSAKNKTDKYLYEDTRRLVALVEDAAALMERDGFAAFAQFKKSGSRWLDDQYYLFVYDINGVCVFHPTCPELIGKSLIDLKDMNGKPMIRFITDIGRKPEADASGWVFYLWEEQMQLIPQWKSSYIRKVVAPDRKIYLLGCGLYDIKIEREFIRERVTLAADLLQTVGKEAAFNAFRDNASPFYFLETYIFVMDGNGNALVDPSFPTLVGGRSLLDLQDAVGMYVVREMINKLRDHDDAWVQYMWPKPTETLPSRKLAYIRKVTLDAGIFIVGSEFFMATPVWMNH